MRPRRRDDILKRTRAIIGQNLPILERWAAKHDDVFDYARPRAGAIATFKYRLPIASVTLFNRLREEHSVLITPGAHCHFGYGGVASLDPQERKAAEELGTKTVDLAYGTLKKAWHPDAGKEPP